MAVAERSGEETDTISFMADCSGSGALTDMVAGMLGLGGLCFRSVFERSRYTFWAHLRVKSDCRQVRSKQKQRNPGFVLNDSRERLCRGSEVKCSKSDSGERRSCQSLEEGAKLRPQCPRRSLRLGGQEAPL